MVNIKEKTTQIAEMVITFASFIAQVMKKLYSCFVSFDNNYIL